jgi:hypothetical protein
MHIDPLILIALGWLSVPLVIGWHVCAGLRLKRQVDEDYAALKALDRAREARWLAELTANRSQS